MIVDFKELRIPYEHPTYPPYHEGYYMEEYFYRYYLKNKKEFDKTGFTLIPIFWTNVYIMEHKGANKRRLIQPFLNALPAGKYFSVSQHDDAVQEQLPEGTLSFEGGGNGNGIPLPLICSKIPPASVAAQRAGRIQREKEKDIFCSFVGSASHPIRDRIRETYANDSDFQLYMKHWTEDVPQEQLNFFIDITNRSKFSLCPRGYGAQSFRFYEIMQLDSIPVVVYDKKWLPFEDVIDYESFCVLVHEAEIPNLKNKLSQITDEQQQQMLKKGKKIYEKYFTLEGMCKQILRVLQASATPSFDSCMRHSVDYLEKPTNTEDWDTIKKVYNNYVTSPKGKDVIPKIIHQIWLGGEMAKQEEEACQLIKESCEKNKWEYKLWTDNDVEDLGDFKNKNLFDKTPNFGQKSDILRNVILYKYGGVYIDTDFILIKPFNELLDLDFFCGVAYDDWPACLNSIMGSKPKGKAITAMQNYDKEIEWHDGMAVIDTTGPYHTTRKVLETIDNKTVVFPNSYFYPYPCFQRHRLLGTNPHEYVKPETFCIHLWAETWNKNFA
jgi:mannosyltransferase OCH1-like enzyme